MRKWKYLEYHDDENGNRFLFIARIIKEKGIEEYLFCAEIIKKEFPNTIFSIIGPCDGEYGIILKEYVKQGIVNTMGKLIIQQTI